MTEMRYTYRERRGLSRSIRLERDGARCIRSDGETIRFRYRDVQRVRLVSPQAGVCMCKIRTRSAGEVAFHSRSLVRDQGARPSFHEKNASFRDFVAALHQKLAPIKGIEYVAGARWSYWVARIGLPSLTLLVLADVGVVGILLTQGKPIPLQQWTTFGMLSGFAAMGLPTMRHQLRCGRLERYAPHRLPERLMSTTDDCPHLLDKHVAH